MGLETGTYVSDLVSTNPLSSDNERQGDDHLRLIKTLLKATFPNASTPFYFPTILSKTANYTVVAADNNALIVVDATAGSFTLSLTSAATLGSRFRFKVFRSDATANIVTIDPSGAELIDFTSTFVLRKQMETIELSSTGTNWISNRGQRGQHFLSPGTIYGLELSNNAGDATNDIDIASGICRDGSDSIDIQLTSGITKRLDAAWAVGTNQGGLDTGAIANTTYFIWAIKRIDTGVVDVLFSASASAPTMPSGYGYKRRIGAIIRSGGTILAFQQIDDTFYLKTPVNDLNTTNPGTGAVLLTLTVPVGIKVEAIMAWFYVDSTPAGGTAISVECPDQTSAASAAFSRFTFAGTQTSTSGGAEVRRHTNTSGQVRYRLSQSTADHSVFEVTYGWVDMRGKHGNA